MPVSSEAPECKGLHGRARDAVGDGQAQVIVRNDAFKLAGVKIDARNQVAILAVAGGALRSENLCAVLNVRLEILGERDPAPGRMRLASRLSDMESTAHK